MATLSFPASTPPLALLAAAKVGHVDVTPKPDQSADKGDAPVLIFENGDQLRGAATLLRYIGRASKLTGFYGVDPASSGEVDEWVDYAPTLAIGAEFERTCAFIDGYLELRTFLAGYQLTIADIAVWAQLQAAGKRWEALLRSASRFPNLSRWFSTALGTVVELQAVTAEYGPKPRGAESKGAPAGDKKGDEKGKGAAKAEAAKEEGSFDVRLPDASEGNVVTRFPPEPSGYLHIGHAKAALLNQYFATKYKGKLIVRFDDTNPSKEKEDFVQNILADLETLGVKGDGPVTYTSDYFDELQAMCERMIKEGKAYVDDTPMERMRAERMVGDNSVHRDNSVEKNLAMWAEMLKGTDKGKLCCVRGKLDMQAPNKAMRDPVYYRCNPVPHHRVGTKYKVYPTYDFACPYVDSKEGVTHALRSSEYHDRNELYDRVLSDMGVRKVHIWDFSRLNFVYTLLSKRKLQWFVDNGKVEGWDDPRFPTVQGIIRRGLTVQALKEFILSQGASKNLNLMEWDKLWTINKKIIDPVCPRHTAIVTEGKVLLTLSNGPQEPLVKVLPRHKKFEGAGKKATTFTLAVWLEQADATAIKEGEEVTLMDWGNAYVRRIHTDLETGLVSGLEGELHLEGSVKTTKLKLTWLPDIGELVPLSLVDLDHLITKPKLEEDDDFTTVLNPVTKRETPALGDANMRNLKKGDVLQLERKGYYIVDIPYLRPQKPVSLIAIPDGRQVKDSKQAATSKK